MMPELGKLQASLFGSCNQTDAGISNQANDAPNALCKGEDASCRPYLSTSSRKDSIGSNRFALNPSQASAQQPTQRSLKCLTSHRRGRKDLQPFNFSSRPLDVQGNEGRKPYT